MHSFTLAAQRTGILTEDNWIDMKDIDSTFFCFEPAISAVCTCNLMCASTKMPQFFIPV